LIQTDGSTVKSKQTLYYFVSICCLCKNDVWQL